MKKLLIQNILFPEGESLPKRDLYYKESDSGIEFTTYFNTFSIKKWFKYTKIETISLYVQIQGTCTLSINAESINNKREILKQTFSDEIEINISNITEMDDIIGFSLQECSDDFKFISGYYFTVIKESSIKDVNLGIGICTFRREEYLLNNLQVLQNNFLCNERSPLYNNLKVFVADNGQTVSNVIKNKALIFNDHIHIFPNINAGGTSGFTRCIIEFLQEKTKPSHILLMDDDATFDPESIFRMYSLLQIIKPEYEKDFIGGAMLKEEHPNEQNENGARWSITQATRPHFFGRDLDLSNTKSIIINEQKNSANYNAWFFCCMPTSTFEEFGLPLPLFIHFDDIEYGIRCSKKIIQLNGICVWHPTANKYSPNMRFYDTRNSIITALLHGKKNCRCQLLFQALKSYVDSMISYKYLDWEMLYQAYTDVFHEKAQCLKKDPQQLHKTIISKKHKTSNLPSSDCFKETITHQELLSRKEYSERLGFKQIKDAIISIICIVLPAFRKDLCAINSTPPFFTPSYRGRKRIYVNISATGNYFILEKSVKQTIISFIQLIKIPFFILFYYTKTKKNFLESKDEITSISFWNKYLQLNK